MSMKVAVVYNRVSDSVINLFGVPNRERIGLKTIKRITDALKSGGHQVVTFEGDKDLIERLEDFLPRVMKGERPGIVFNLSYGIQGQARYTHVPSILEMVGIPYVGSGPLAHSIALDKVVTKMVLRQNDLPTPDFAVLDTPDFEPPDLPYPVIVKPKNEAVSFGLRIVESPDALRPAAQVIFDTYDQAVLVEQYIAGREINVGILGNDPPEAFPPAEIIFGSGGPPIYTYEDKTRTSGREVTARCPADLTPELDDHARRLGVAAFRKLGCADCARIDMRMDEEGGLYILEVNSLPSMGEHGSYVAAAEAIGLDFPALVNRLVEAASARYFGTPAPPRITARSSAPPHQVFSFVTENRSQMEKRVKEWCGRSSRSSDLLGIRAAVGEVGRRMRDVGLEPVDDLSDRRMVWTWRNRAGLRGGTLLIVQLDVPLEPGVSRQPFRRDGEWLYGEGAGASRAPLTSVEFALRALRAARRLHRNPMGVLIHADEGEDCTFSAELIRAAADRARRVFVLRPGNPGDRAILQRRGMRKYVLTAVDRPQRVGRPSKRPDMLSWTCARVEDLSGLSSRRGRVSVSVTDLRCTALPMMLPHEVAVRLLLSYPDEETADRTSAGIRELLDDRSVRWSLELVADRPPMQDRKRSHRLFRRLKELADYWDLPLEQESSVLPSVAGLVPETRPVVCGLGPVARDLYTPDEAVSRMSLVQRTLLLAEFLLDPGQGSENA